MIKIGLRTRQHLMLGSSVRAETDTAGGRPDRGIRARFLRRDHKTGHQFQSGYTEGSEDVSETSEILDFVRRDPD